jgi:hypothetical protein
VHRSFREDWDDVPNGGLVLVDDDDRTLLVGSLLRLEPLKFF